MAYIQAAAIVVRCQFYAGWKMAEAVCAVNSIAYSGDDPVTKKPTYNRAANVYVKGVELAENGKSVTDSWNCYTNRWLKRCIYERIPVMKTFGTYLGSAIWHGFKRNGYLMQPAFILLSLAQHF